MSATTTPRRCCEAVRHIRTGRMNGWFLTPGTARAVADAFREIYPGELFDVVELVGTARVELDDGVWLDFLAPDFLTPAARLFNVKEARRQAGCRRAGP